MDDVTPLRKAAQRAHEEAVEFAGWDDAEVVVYDRDTDGPDRAVVTVPEVYAGDIERAAVRISNHTDGVTHETPDDQPEGRHRIRFRPQ